MLSNLITQHTAKNEVTQEGREATLDRQMSPNWGDRFTVSNNEGPITPGRVDIVRTSV